MAKILEECSYDNAEVRDEKKRNVIKEDEAQLNYEDKDSTEVEDKQENAKNIS